MESRIPTDNIEEFKLLGDGLLQEISEKGSNKDLKAEYTDEEKTKLTKFVNFLQKPNEDTDSKLHKNLLTKFI